MTHLIDLAAANNISDEEAARQALEIISMTVDPGQVLQVVAIIANTVREEPEVFFNIAANIPATIPRPEVDTLLANMKRQIKELVEAHTVNKKELH